MGSRTGHLLAHGTSHQLHRPQGRRARAGEVPGCPPSLRAASCCKVLELTSFCVEAQAWW